MYKPLVSVMIPFHNSQSTLRKCMDSVIALHYRPLEVILVDDASTDLSAKIVSDYIEANKYENLNIKLIRHTCNKGVAAARDTALQAASGEYITAVDADDFIDAEAIDRYVEATESGKIDLVAAAVVYEYPDKSEIHRFSPHEQLTLKEVTIDSLHFLLTNKLIRTAKLREVQPFTEGQNCWEDLGAIARMLALGASTKIIDGAWYHYVQTTEGSLTKSNPDKILYQHIAVTRNLEQWMESQALAHENLDFLNYLKFIAKVKFLRNKREVLKHPISRLRGWRDTFPEVNAHIYDFKKVKLKYRMLFIGAYQVSKLIPKK